ncbi:MAG: ATP-dependent DNA helicase RecQ [Bacteroidota bacterium]
MIQPTPEDILKKYWGYDSFRPQQKEIIQTILGGQDTFALLPTGGGKSVCFQVPGLMLDGLTIVISPLIALMKDQVERLNRMGIAATYINSGMSYAQIDQKLDAAILGTYRFLYVAPERLKSEMFRLRLPKLTVSLLAVDEAHCISQWGYDFRPAYLEIAKIREIKPNIPVVALTASATPAVKEDIIQKLEMKQPQIFAKSFRRENLRYFVLHEERIAPKILEIVQRIKGTGIVYARTRKTTEKLAAYLQDHGISAKAYHGGLRNSERGEIQQDWLEDRSRIMVATNAFGMGIDKSDVRFVIHYNLPFDLESYYQEAGRGGRDGKTALAIAFLSGPDLRQLRHWNADKYPQWEMLTKHYRLLCEYFQVPNSGRVERSHDLLMPELVKSLNVPALQLYASLKILHQEGLLHMTEEKDDFAYVMMLAQPRDVLQYKATHPLLADLITFLLRTLGGEVYIQEKRFLPEHWARRLDLPPLELHYQLQRLAQHKMILYTPSTDKPSIRFLLPRQKLQKKSLNWDKYAFLKSQNDLRLEKMIDYIQDTEVCRSVIIQSYFGETDQTSCGVCDVCSGRFKRELTGKVVDKIQEAILTFLAGQTFPYKRVIQEVSVGSPIQRKEVLRMMMDQEVVLLEDGNMLRLAQKEG